MQIKELKRDWLRRPKLLSVTLLPGVSVELTPKQLEFAYLQNAQYNLLYAEEHGIKPLSYEEVAEQIKPEQQKNIVLFDTASGFLPGNHWRVIKTDEEQKKVSLQLCGVFGNHDSKDFPTVDVSFEIPMFTGISIQSYEHEGKSLTLQETVSIVEQSHLDGKTEYPKHLGEVILFSNETGILSPMQKE